MREIRRRSRGKENSSRKIDGRYSIDSKRGKEKNKDGIPGAIDIVNKASKIFKIINHRK